MSKKSVAVSFLSIEITFLVWNVITRLILMDGNGQLGIVLKKFLFRSNKEGMQTA